MLFIFIRGGRQIKTETPLYEELSANAHPALQTELYDGWVLRFANGHTNRANSVSFLYPSALDANEKISECERRYFAQGLPAVFKITDDADPEFEKKLEERGYAVVSPTYLMTMDLNNDFKMSGDFIFTDHADDEWLDSYFLFEKYDNAATRSTVKLMLENIKNTAIYGRVIKNGAVAACGSAVIERGYMGLFSVIVDEALRGKGYGKELCESLIAAAKNAGARASYLQAVCANEKAVNLYTKLGYKALYSYHYRIKKENDSYEQHI